MIKQTGRLVGACRFVLAGDGLTLTLPHSARPFHAIKFQFYRQNSGILQHPGIKIGLKPFGSRSIRDI